MTNYQRLMVHTAVVNRHSGTVNAAGDIPYGDAQYDVQGTIDCRRLTTRAANQQVAESDGKVRRWLYQVYAYPDADVLFGDHLTNIAVKATGGTVGGTVWGTPYAVLDAGPLEVTAVSDVIERGLAIKILEVERVT